MGWICCSVFYDPKDLFVDLVAANTCVYPTLVDLCGLPVPEHVEGVSLRPLLENPDAPWERTALTTHGRGHHGVRCERWRYIRYSTGEEELYDHDSDPHEWHNLALNETFVETKRRLARHLPQSVDTED